MITGLPDICAVVAMFPWLEATTRVLPDTEGAGGLLMGIVITN